jgi:hypothetical protein
MHGMPVAQVLGRERSLGCIHRCDAPQFVHCQDAVRGRFQQLAKTLLGPGPGALSLSVAPSASHRPSLKRCCRSSI